MDAEENKRRLALERHKMLESDEKLSPQGIATNSNPNGLASGENFEAQKNAVIAELEEVITKLRKLNGINPEFVLDTDIPKDTSDVT